MATAVWPITISQQRIRWNAVDGHPAIRLRHHWGAQRSYTDGRAVEDRPATRVFIHISVTNPGNYRGNDAHAQAIERIGISRFSSTGISYNFGVMPNAALYEFQPVGRRGAHTVNNYRISTCTRSGAGCPGRNQPLTARSWNLNYNARSIVICQNVNDPVTDAQIDKIARTLVTCYRAGFITRHACHNPHGHRCVSSKSCPGERMWKRMWDLHTKIHYYLDHGLGAVQEDDMPLDNKDLAKIEGLLTKKRGEFGFGSDGAVSIASVGAHRYAWGGLKTTERVEDKVDALLAAQEGLDTPAILARINQRHDDADAQRAELAAQIKGATDLLQEHAEGNLDAEAVVEAFRQLFHEATAPSDDTDG